MTEADAFTPFPYRATGACRQIGLAAGIAMRPARLVHTRHRGLGERCTVRQWPWSDCELDALCNRDSLTCVFYKKGDDPEDEQVLYGK